MNDQEIAESRYRFFSERGMATAADFDKVLVTLFTGIIAGIIALVVTAKVGILSAAAFLVAAGLAVSGLAMCLLHIMFTSKAMILLAAQFAGEDAVPNVVAREQPTAEVVVRIKANAQRCYEGQLLHLFLSVAFAALGLVIELWRSVLVGAAVGLVVLAVLAGTVWFAILKREQ